MSPPERCPACPVAPGVPCRTMEAGLRNENICRYVADGRPKWIEWVKAGEPDPSGPAPQPWLDKHLLITGCDYRGERNGNGCGCTHACLMGKGQVSYRQCAECVAATDA